MRKSLVILAAGLFLVSWGLRLATLEPVFQVDDSPETAAACDTLGIQHPPGYPLPTLLGRLACLAFPGNPGFRVNLQAALWGCLSVALFLFMLGDLAALAGPAPGPWPPWQVLACLGLVLMPQLWYQSLSAKGGLYTLNLLLTLLAWYCLWKAARSLAPARGTAPDRAGFSAARRLLWAGSLAFGLGFAGHYMSIVLFLPTFGLLALPWLKDRARRRALAFTPPLFLAGASIYLYLPLRSRLHPAMDWGHPDTWRAFWGVFWRSQYQGGRSHSMAEAGVLAGHFLKMLPDQMAWLWLPLALWGLWLAWRRREWMLRSLMLGLGLHLAAVILYNNPPTWAPWVADAFYLPDFVLLWLFATLGLADLARRLPGRPARLALGAGLGLGLALFLPRAWAMDRFQNDTLLYDYSRDLLAALPRRSVLLAAGGDDAFGVWYLQRVEGRRTDVVLADAPLFSPWYLEDLRRQVPQASWSGADRDAIVRGLVAASLDRPLFYSAHNPGDLGIPLGLSAFVAKGNVGLNLGRLEAPWRRLRLRGLRSGAFPPDGGAVELLGYYPECARALERFGDRLGQPQVAALGRRWEGLVSRAPAGPGASLSR